MLGHLYLVVHHGKICAVGFQKYLNNFLIVMIATLCSARVEVLMLFISTLKKKKKKNLSLFLTLLLHHQPDQSKDDWKLKWL